MEKYINAAYKTIAEDMEKNGIVPADLVYDEEDNTLWINREYQLFADGRVRYFGKTDEYDEEIGGYLYDNGKLVQICAAHWLGHQLEVEN